jgi:hypothetical protein
VNIPISGDTVVVGPNNSQQPGTEATLDIQVRLFSVVYVVFEPMRPPMAYFLCIHSS